MAKLVKTLGWSAVILIAIILTVAGSAYLAGRIGKHKAIAPACSSEHAARHMVRILNGTTTPSHTDAKRCDKLTITNLDNTNRLIAFGVHDSHKPYDGIEERLLGKNQSLEVVLIDTGSFRFHDHLDDAAQGTFTVR